LIGFEDSTGKVFTYPSLSSTVSSPLSEGEVVFKLAPDTKKRIGLDGSNVKSFYLLSQTPTGGQTKLYVGTVDSDVNMKDEADRVKTLGSQAVTVQSLLAAGSSPGTVTGNTTLTQDLGVAAQDMSLISQLNQMSSSAVSASEKQDQVLPPVIPGFTTDTNASSLNAIVPSGK
jgi:hypothetical protein